MLASHNKRNKKCTLGVVSLLDLATWGEGGQELIILVLLNLILGEITGICLGLRLGGDLGYRAS